MLEDFGRENKKTGALNIIVVTTTFSTEMLLLLLFGVSGSLDISLFSGPSVHSLRLSGCQYLKAGPQLTTHGPGVPDSLLTSVPLGSQLPPDSFSSTEVSPTTI